MVLKWNVVWKYLRKYRVPEGSILGPLMYLNVHNDMHKCLKYRASINVQMTLQYMQVIEVLNSLCTTKT